MHNLDGATATLYIFHDVTAQAHARREIEEMSMKSTRQAEQLRLAHAQLSARARELATLLHISHALAATLEVQPLLDKILDQMYTMIAYRSAIPYLVEDENIIAAAYRGPLPDKQVIGVQIPLTSMPGCDDLTRCQRPVVIDDLQSESDMAQAIRQATQRYFPEAMQATHAWMSVPLLINSTTARRFISARQAVSAPLTKTRNVISFMRCARMRRPTPHMSQHNINVGARCRNLEVHPMFRRSVLHRLLATVLLLFLLAACGGAGGDSAAAANNVATNARFAEQQAHGIHGWLAASTPPVTGVTSVDAYLEGDGGQPIADATVTFDVDMTNMSHGKTLVPTHATGGGYYAGDVHFMMPGPWRIIATIERPGHTPVALRFNFWVQTP